MIFNQSDNGGNGAGPDRNVAPKQSPQQASSVSREESNSSQRPAQRRAAHWRTRTDNYVPVSDTDNIRIDYSTFFAVSIAAATSASMIAIAMAMTLRLGPIVAKIPTDGTMHHIDAAGDGKRADVRATPSVSLGGDEDAGERVEPHSDEGRCDHHQTHNRTSTSSDETRGSVTALRQEKCIENANAKARLESAGYQVNKPDNSNYLAHANGEPSKPVPNNEIWSGLDRFLCTTQFIDMLNYYRKVGMSVTKVYLV